MEKKKLEIGLLALLHSVQHIYLYALPPLYTILRVEFNITTFQIGLLGSVYGVVSVFQGPAGYLVERIGSKQLSVFSMLGCSAAVFMYSLAQNFNFLLLAATLFALSQVVFHPATYAMVTERSSSSNRARYIAYHQVGGFIGSAIGTVLIAALASIFGWRFTLQIIPIFGILIILLFWKLVIDEPNIVQETITRAPDSLQLKNSEFHFSTPLFVLILSISLLSIGNIQNFIPLFLSEVYGENVVWAGILTGIMIAIGSSMSLVGGVLSDKYDKTLILIGANVGLGISMILLAVGQFSSALLLIILILFGIARYMPVPAQHALSSIAAEEHPQGIGFSYTGLAIGQVVSSPLMGYLIDSHGVRSSFLLCSIFPFASIFFLIWFKKIFKIENEDHVTQK